MVAARPDLFCAYVGTGQEVNKRRAEAWDYAEVLRRARLAQNSEAEKALLAIGAPLYRNSEDLGVEQRWESAFAVKSEQKFNSMDYVRNLYPSDFTDKDMADRMKGSLASYRAVYGSKSDGPIFSVNLLAKPAVFQVPMFFIQGQMDDVTPTSLVREYVRHIRAPRKSLVVIPGDGHLALMADPERFLKEMRRLLLPTTCCTGSGPQR
jgi:pimeloyl-ACP methyl ester carboxylesterase